MHGDDYRVFLLALLIGWFISIVYAAGFGAQRNAFGSGLFLGIVFGPIGMIAAGLLDSRPTCQRCGGRQSIKPEGNPYPACEHCGADNSRSAEDD